ncbi:hypothetical protein RchiOBHm_Chr1g0383471 [Rosa chinensis]|uniref:Uncharacterized protein n=1 Tax=Rosa chinensis TaxID=74649 RepID=A0A2P6SPN8_ROSCH|nr:hypothetical protein RchiOBHm_Chr1g0383471 [Rosa chinensis]
MNWGILAYMKSGSSIKRRRLQALDVNKGLGNEQHKREVRADWFSLLLLQPQFIFCVVLFQTYGSFCFHFSYGELIS